MRNYEVLQNYYFILVDKLFLLSSRSHSSLNISLTLVGSTSALPSSLLTFSATQLLTGKETNSKSSQYLAQSGAHKRWISFHPLRFFSPSLDALAYSRYVDLYSFYRSADNSTSVEQPQVVWLLWNSAQFLAL